MSIFPNRAAAAYRNVDVNTRVAEHDQYELALMMFEAVLESVAVAQGAIDAQNMSVKIKQINRAVKILQDGLRTSLDLDNGGELAKNLDALYDYCVLRLTEANAFNDTAKLAEVGTLIKPVAEAWKQMRTSQAAEVQTSNEVESAADTPAQPHSAARRMSSMYATGMAFA